jgi:GT2 family glycosyltransferase/glycosyltransferase involved in cell wall biosynthesis
MKVLVIVHAFPPIAEGGSEVYADAQARALARGGDDVLVLTREADPLRREYHVRRDTRDGVRVVWINNMFRRTRSLDDSYRNPAIAAIAERVIDEFRPDVAHVHHLTCLSTLIVPALAARNIPVVFTLHDYWLMCHRGQLFDLDHRICSTPGSCGRCLGLQGAAPPSAFLAARALSRVLPKGLAQACMSVAQGFSPALGREDAEARRRTDHMRGIMAHVTRFLAPSRFMRDLFIEFGVPPEQIVHSPYGFEVGLSEGPADRPRQGDGGQEAGRHGQNRLRLGFIGSLMVSKAPHVLLEAARDVDGVAGVDLFGALAPYHGDDSYLRSLAPLLASPGVTHHGPTPHRRIPEALASIDLLVVPSVWPENSPLVIHEAFLAGVPVIASRIGGIPEIVEHERNGLLFEAGNVDSLRQAIARVVDEPGLLERLRAGIGPARPIEDDVAATREMYMRIAGLTSFAEASAVKKACATTDRKVAQGFSPAKKTQPRRLAAVVLNYRTPDETYLAVRSLLASRRTLDDIIVVNNDEEGDDERHIRSHSDVRRIDTGCNLGFSGGVNVGIRDALERGADAVLLVNSDVILPPDCVEHLERTLAGRPGCGIVGPAIASRSAPGLVASLGISYNPATGRMRHRGFGDRRPADIDGRRMPAEPQRVDGVSACAMLIAREVVDAIGLFDEDYFFGFEDLDFCLRARRAGFDTMLAADATAYHEGSRSIGGSSPERLYFAARNHLLLASRISPASSIVRRSYRLSTIVALNVAHAAIANGATLPRRMAAVARGTRDYLAGRYGPARSPAAFEDGTSSARVTRPRNS